MDSVPEQHINSRPEHKREEAYVQVAMVCTFRKQGFSEEEVAERAHFSLVDDMYFRLKRWGYDIDRTQPDDLGKTLVYTLCTAKLSYEDLTYPAANESSHTPRSVDALFLLLDLLTWRARGISCYSVMQEAHSLAYP